MFQYLGIHIVPGLDSAEEIKIRIQKASQAFGFWMPLEEYVPEQGHKDVSCLDLKGTVFYILTS